MILGFLGVAASPLGLLGLPMSLETLCVRADRRAIRAANFVDLTLTDDCHSRLCFAMVVGFVDPQPSTHCHADRLPFCPDIEGRCFQVETVSVWTASGWA